MGGSDGALTPAGGQPPSSYTLVLHDVLLSNETFAWIELHSMTEGRKASGSSSPPFRIIVQQGSVTHLQVRSMEELGTSAELPHRSTVETGSLEEAWTAYREWVRYLESECSLRRVTVSHPRLGSPLSRCRGHSLALDILPSLPRELHSVTTAAFVELERWTASALQVSKEELAAFLKAADPSDRLAKGLALVEELASKKGGDTHSVYLTAHGELASLFPAFEMDVGVLGCEAVDESLSCLGDLARIAEGLVPRVFGQDDAVDAVYSALGVVLQRAPPGEAHPLLARIAEDNAPSSPSSRPEGRGGVSGEEAVTRLADFVKASRSSVAARPPTHVPGFTFSQTTSYSSSSSSGSSSSTMTTTTTTMSLGGGGGGGASAATVALPPLPLVTVQAIYSVSRPGESLAFARCGVTTNHQLLFHGVRAHHLAGVLARGLRPPHLAETDDPTMEGSPSPAHAASSGAAAAFAQYHHSLGRGIYFSASPRLAAKYASEAAHSTGLKYMFVARVALGTAASVTEPMPHLRAPLFGKDSMHGVGNTAFNASQFPQDIFVVYRPDQVKLEYLIEFTTTGVAPSSRFEPLRVWHYASASATTAKGVIRSQLMEVMQRSVTRSDPWADRPLSLPPPPPPRSSRLTASGGAAVALTAVHIRARLADLVGEVTVFQVYTNGAAACQSAAFEFPLPERAAVCAFEAFINSKRVVGHVKTKAAARDVYDKAVAQGHGAYLMEKVEEADSFKVALGNVPSWARVVIKVVYVTRTVMEGSTALFCLPHGLFPLSRSELVSSAGSCLSIEVGLTTVYDLVHVGSSTHPLDTKRTATTAAVRLSSTFFTTAQAAGSGGGRGVSATSSSSSSSLDFVMEYETEHARRPRMLVERAPNGHCAAMLTFFTEGVIASDFGTDVVPDLSAQATEVVVTVDLSSSSSTASTVAAVSLLLTSLEEAAERASPTASISFNVVVFGSVTHYLYMEAVPVSRAAVCAAKSFVDTMATDRLGGTDLVGALTGLLTLAPLSSATRNIVLVSDGHIPDLASCLTLLSDAATPATPTPTATSTPSSSSGGSKARFPPRLFAIMIKGEGGAGSPHTGRVLAKAGNGVCVTLDPEAKSKWAAAVKGLVTKTTLPCLANVAIEWKESNDTVVESVPSAPGALYPGDSLTVFGFVDYCTEAFLTASPPPSSRGYSSEGSALSPITTLRSQVTAHPLSFVSGLLVHRLTAQAHVNEWEDGSVLVRDPVERELVRLRGAKVVERLGLDYSLVTPFTSFVAVEERMPGGDNESEKESAPPLSQLLAEASVDALAYIEWEPPAAAHGSDHNEGEESGRHSYHSLRRNTSTATAAATTPTGSSSSSSTMMTAGLVGALGGDSYRSSPPYPVEDAKGEGKRSVKEKGKAGRKGEVEVGGRSTHSGGVRDNSTRKGDGGGAGGGAGGGEGLSSALNARDGGRRGRTSRHAAPSKMFLTEADSYVAPEVRVLRQPALAQSQGQRTSGLVNSTSSVSGGESTTTPVSMMAGKGKMELPKDNEPEDSEDDLPLGLGDMAYEVEAPPQEEYDEGLSLARDTSESGLRLRRQGPVDDDRRMSKKEMAPEPHGEFGGGGGGGPGGGWGGGGLGGLGGAVGMGASSSGTSNTSSVLRIGADGSSSRAGQKRRAPAPAGSVASSSASIVPPRSSTSSSAPQAPIRTSFPSAAAPPPLPSPAPIATATAAQGDRFRTITSERQQVVLREVEEAKAMMKDNIDRVMERGESIEFLQTRSSELETASKSFYVSSRQLSSRTNFNASLYQGLYLLAFHLVEGRLAESAMPLSGAVVGATTWVLAWYLERDMMRRRSARKLRALSAVLLVVVPFAQLWFLEDLTALPYIVAYLMPQVLSFLGRGSDTPDSSEMIGSLMSLAMTFGVWRLLGNPAYRVFLPLGLLSVVGPLGVLAVGGTRGGLRPLLVLVASSSMNLMLNVVNLHGGIAVPRHLHVLTGLITLFNVAVLTTQSSDESEASTPQSSPSSLAARVLSGAVRLALVSTLTEQVTGWSPHGAAMEAAPWSLIKSPTTWVVGGLLTVASLLVRRFWPVAPPVRPREASTTVSPRASGLVFRPDGSLVSVAAANAVEPPVPVHTGLVLPAELADVGRAHAVPAMESFSNTMREVDDVLRHRRGLIATHVEDFYRVSESP